MASSTRMGVILAFLCFVLGAFAEEKGPDFPHIKDFNLEFYQTEVQITDNIKQFSGFVSEYYDSSTPRGRLEIKDSGKTASYFYNNETDEVTFVDVDGNCESQDTGISELTYQEIFYGWLHRQPLIIGPSALLWYANSRRNDIQYEGRVRIRKIECDAYSLSILGDKDDTAITYYFAAEGWTTPYQMKGMRVPIRIEAIGKSSRLEASGKMALVNLTNDFAYFRPTIADWMVFQPPLGLGCKHKKATLTMPKIPQVYMYSAEVFDVLKTDPDAPELTYDVENHHVWYDRKHSMARIDVFSRSGYMSELSDFNTGVKYKIDNGRSCQIKPLRNSFFEAEDKRLVGFMKDPEEIMKLDAETFYYMGKRLMRGIWCDTFESVEYDVFFMKKSLKKLVVTAYFSQDYYEVAVDGETEGRIPIFYQIKGWDKDTELLVLHLQYNVFAFDDEIYPEMYTSFSLGRCFPSLNDKSYFVLMMNVAPTLAAKMEEKDDLIKELIKGQIYKYAKVSDMRMPLLSIDYKSTGVIVTGLILDRPPALKQFYLEFEGEIDEVADNLLKLIPDADTQEKCAFSCAGNKDFTCLGFYMCKNTCWLKSRSILADKGGEKTTNFQESCQTWLRAVGDSVNNEAYLADALKSLEEAVLNQKVKIEFQLDENTDKIIPIEQIAIGDGPYTGVGQDKPYDIVIKFAKLANTDVTTQKVEYVDSVNDCFKACKDSESIACASFSFCPKATNKQCMLTSTLFVDRKKNPDGTEDDQNCYIYSLKYIDLYEPYPGRVSLIGGDDAYTNIATLEDCARTCKEDKKIKCRGFEFCRSEKTCVLHSRHILDLRPEEVAIDKNKKSTCVHYAAKYTNDYDDMGYTMIDDTSDARNELSLEECAQICSEELKSTCKSFNYCPASEPYSTDSVCYLSSKTLAEQDVTTTVRDMCHHYEKKKVDDWRKPDQKAIPKASGYTSKGFTGLVIGMLALGLIVGALGFVGYSYFRSRAGGDGMTVRFMKQPT